MIDAIAWLIVLEGLGLLAVPYLYLIFPKLPDRGLGFNKVFGVLGVGYLFWLLGSVHAVPNGRGAVAFAVFLFLLGSVVLFRKHASGLPDFLRQRRGTLLLYEAVFILAFVLIAVLRAYNPDISGTEKPMDFAMLNTAVRSAGFPPQDPWLAGFSVNYYYFGYLLMGMLTQLTGSIPAVGFNLALAFLFAGACTGAWSLVANLVALHGANGLSAVLPRRALAFGGVAAVLFLGMGNPMSVLEIARAHEVGSPDFWAWVEVKKGYNAEGNAYFVGVPPQDSTYQSEHWYPTENWWWWRTTRVIDTIVDGKSEDYTITEFPAFSFVLGDLHPHVMALPFAVLAVALAFHLLLGPRPGLRSWWRASPWLFLPPMLVLGSLGFVNGWDLAPYVALYLGVGGVRVLLDRPHSWRSAADYLVWIVAIGAGSLVLYAPFYLGILGWVLAIGQPPALAERAAGIGIPVALWLGPATRPLHFFLVFGPLLVIVLSFLCVAAVRTSRYTGGLIVGACVSMVAVWLAYEAGLLQLDLVGRMMKSVQRLWFALPVLLVAVTLFSRTERSPSGDDDQPLRGRSPSVVFALSLVAMAFLLVATSETLRLTDVFGNRMNTVFKSYYQTWLLLALASAFGISFILGAKSRMGRVSGIAWSGGLGLLVAPCLLFLPAAAFSKTDGLHQAPKAPTLDGMTYLQRNSPDEEQALRWLAMQPGRSSVVLEATGGQYTFYARASTHTGMPTVLGWGGHEVQWRGSDAAFRGRTADIDAIYLAADKGAVMPLLETYGIDYVYVGSLERQKYPLPALDAFKQSFEPVFMNAGVTIYKIPRAAAAG